MRRMTTRSVPAITTGVPTNAMDDRKAVVPRYSARTGFMVFL
jgi:hypothetical protein